MADGPRGLSLWSLSTPSIVYVLTVECAALVSSAALISTELNSPGQHIDRDALIAFAVVVACSVIHLQASRRIERVRRSAIDTPQVDLTSIWVVGAVFCLPPTLALGVVACTRVQRWTMCSRPPHRNLFSAAAITLSTCAAAGVVQLTGYHPEPWAGVLQSVNALTVLAAASVAYWASQVVLVAAAFALTTRRPTMVNLVGDWDLNVLDVATVCLGVLVSLVLSQQPLLLLFAVPVALVLHKTILVGQFEHAARRDSKTGLANAAHWLDVARKELENARRQGGGFGILIVDLDHFKNLNDRYGHLAGDDVLRAVADALCAEVPGYDVVGRFGGEEFSILISGIDNENLLLHTGDRVRRCVERLNVTITADEGVTAVVGVTASVGAALYPVNAITLDGLLRVADTALYAAKRAGRNRTRLAAVTQTG